MPDIALDRIDPQSNCFRFYDIDIDRDLFGGHCLVIHWGRLGRPGRCRIAASGTDEDLRLLARRIARRKRAKGYDAVERPR